jgi:hypothetical protein
MSAYPIPQPPQNIFAQRMQAPGMAQNGVMMGGQQPMGAMPAHGTMMPGQSQPMQPTSGAMPFRGTPAMPQTPPSGMMPGQVPMGQPQNAMQPQNALRGRMMAY